VKNGGTGNDRNTMSVDLYLPGRTRTATKTFGQEKSVLESCGRRSAERP